MLNFLPESWFAVLITAVLGFLAFLAMELIRMKEQRSQGKIPESMTLFEFIKSRFYNLIPQKMTSEEEERNQEDNKKEKVPAMRRGGSSTNLAGSVKENRKKLRKQHSVNSNDLHLSGFFRVK